MNLHPLQQAHASFALHKELISFAEEGLFDHMRRKKTASLALLKGALSEKVADSLSMFLPTKGMSFSQDMLGQGMELTYRKYLVWLSETFVLPDTPARGKYALLPHHYALPQAEQLVQEILGPVESVTLEHENPVQRAYLVASHNQLMANARLAALHFLLAEVRGQGRSVSDDLEAEVDQAATVIHARLQHFAHRKLMFAVLLGGDILQEARAEMVESNFGADYAVMHYLEPEERLPSRWLTDEEEAFREALQACVNNGAN